MTRIALKLVAVASLFAAGTAVAQTANSSPTAGAGGGDVSRTAPSGGTARPNPGLSQVGAPTPLEQHYDHKADKAAGSVCKGC